MESPTVDVWIARCPYCPISVRWDSGYVFKEETARKLYLLHLQVKHPARYAKLTKRRLKESGEI